jgi:hypothetical protein
MTFRLSEDDIPDTEPWTDREFLWHCYHERGLSPRAIAYELGVSKSRVTVHMDRLGVLKPWTHEPTLRRLNVEEGLSATEIVKRKGFDCTPATVRKYLMEYDLIEQEGASYGRLDALEV